jgi:hypothetical protein
MNLREIFTELDSSRHAARWGDTQKAFNILWKPKVHFRVRNNPPMIPILKQTNPVITTPFYLSKVYLNCVGFPFFFSP